MPRGCDYSVRVEIDVQKHKGRGRQPNSTGVRRFIVEFDADGVPLRIKEIRQKEPPQLGIYHHAFWHAGSHPVGTGETLPRRIIAAAHAKTLAEHRAANATP